LEGREVSGGVVGGRKWTYHCVVAVWSGVLAERTQHDAVLEGETSELEGLEELWDIFPAVGEEGSSGGRILERSEVWRVRSGAVVKMGWGRHCGCSLYYILYIESQTV
jgi:hypothetical protein